MTIAVQGVGVGPVAVGGEDVAIAVVLPEFEVVATGKGADLRSRGVEDLQEIVERVGVERHADEANEHGRGFSRVDFGIAMEKLQRATLKAPSSEECRALGGGVGLQVCMGNPVNP